MKLQQLYHDKEVLSELKKFLLTHIIDEGVKGMLAQEDVVWVAEAHRAVETAFDRLDTVFGSKEQVVKKDNKNQAR